MLVLAQVVSQFPTQYFGKLPGFNLWKLTRFSGVFSRFEGNFLKWTQECEVKLRHVIYEVCLVIIFSSRSKYGTFENE